MRIPFAVIGLPVLLLFLLVSGCGEYRRTTRMTVCICNMKQIQSAVEQAMEAGMAKPTLKDICGPDKCIKLEPKCPLGGSYTIKFTGKDFKIICPHADKGHVLPQ